MDSLIALELRNELAKALGLEGKISATVAFDTGTVGELTNWLINLRSPTTVSASPAKGPERVAAADSKMVSAEALENMTDAEVEELLRSDWRNDELSGTTKGAALSSEAGVSDIAGGGGAHSRAGS